MFNYSTLKWCVGRKNAFNRIIASLQAATVMYILNFARDVEELGQHR